MAPVPPPPGKAPSASTLRRQRITGQIHPLLPAKIFRPNAATSDAFLSSKRDRRLIKHSSFVSKIGASARVSKSSSSRRRRPGKKLKANLESLADALPELAEGAADADLAGKVKHRSLRSRKGALKRKERVVKGEMERFGVSMARLAVAQAGGATLQAQKPAGVQQGGGVGGGDDDDDDEDEMDDVDDQMAAKAAASAPTPTPASDRWAALRGYISATMEQNPAFIGKN